MVLVVNGELWDPTKDPESQNFSGAQVLLKVWFMELLPAKLLEQRFLKCDFWAAASSSPGDGLEMLVIRPPPQAAISETLGMGPGRVGNPGTPGRETHRSSSHSRNHWELWIQLLPLIHPAPLRFLGPQTYAEEARQVEAGPAHLALWFV